MHTLTKPFKVEFFTHNGNEVSINSVEELRQTTPEDWERFEKYVDENTSNWVRIDLNDGRFLMLDMNGYYIDDQGAIIKDIMGGDPQLERLGYYSD